MMCSRLLHRLFSPLHRRSLAVSSAVLLAIAPLTACSFRESRQIQEVMLCQWNYEYTCSESKTSFLVSASDIMVNANLEQVVEGTQIKITWIYQGGELGRPINIASSIFEKPDESVTSMYSILSRPNNGWPEGDYYVRLSSDENGIEEVVESFYISASQSSDGTNRDQTTIAQQSAENAAPDDIGALVQGVNPTKILGDVVLCQLNDEDDCVTELALLHVNSPGVRLKANVAKAPVGTTVEAHWRYVEGQADGPRVLETASLTKNNETIIWVESNLKKPVGGWTVGQYEVALSLVPDAATLAIKRFWVR